MPSPEKVPSIPTDDLPPWGQQYDMRIIQGTPLAFSKEKTSDTSLTQQWIKDKVERPLDFLSLTAISDAFFPHIYVRRRELVPIGTVSMTLYYHIIMSSLTSINIEPILGKIHGQQFYNGYFDQTVELWSNDGKLLVTSMLLVYYKE